MISIIRGVFVVLVTLTAFVVSACGAAHERQDGATEITRAAEASSSKPYDFDGRGANVNESRFGDSWPLTIVSGRVNCIGSGGRIAVVFTTDENVRYALNGFAKQDSESWGYKDVNKIWADNPENPGAKKDIGVLIDICESLM